MTELDRLFAEYEPLSPPLEEQEIQAIQKRIQMKTAPRRINRRLAILLAAAMCLLAACGAIAIGLFDTMTDVNQTEKLVKKYGLVLEEPQSVTVDGHTVTLQAMIRSDTIARIVYDVSGSENEANSWGSFENPLTGRMHLRVQPLTNGQPSGYTDLIPDYGSEAGYCMLRQSGPVGHVSESNSTRYFADFDLTENADTVSLYVLYESGGAEVLQAPLPEPAAEKQAALPDVAIPVTTEEGEVNYIFQQVVITPFYLSLSGIHNDELMTLWDAPYDWYQYIRLYDANGKELQIGRDGTFFTTSGNLGPDDFTIELGTYDLLDPSEVAEIEIDGVRYPVD